MSEPTAEYKVGTERIPKMRDGHIPASIRIPRHLDFDSCLEHVKYNIEKLSEMLTTEGEVYPFDVLNHIVPIITNVCKLVEKPTQGHEDETFCLQTRLKSCHEEDIENLESELKSIKGNDIYGKLRDARNKTVAHTNISYEKYWATQKALLEDALDLIKRENRLKNLVTSIESLVYNIEMSVRKEKGEPLNVDTFEIRVRARVPKSDKRAVLKDVEE